MPIVNRKHSHELHPVRVSLIEGKGRLRSALLATAEDTRISLVDEMSMVRTFGININIPCLQNASMSYVSISSLVNHQPPILEPAQLCCIVDHRNF